MNDLTTGEWMGYFVSAIAPNENDLLKTQRLSDRIEGRLESDFAVKRFRAVGSHWKGTAVRRFSDLDLFIVFSREEAKKWSPRMTSSVLIARVRRSLAATYPNTNLRIDKQSVRITFEQGAHAVDVVPAVFDQFDVVHRAPVFLIPDGDGGWLRTAPDLHKRLTDDAHQQSGRKLKGLVRLLKWWASSRADSSMLSSLYVEWFIRLCSIPVSYTYQQALHAVFEALARTRCKPIEDPYGISDEPIKVAKTPRQRALIMKITLQSLKLATLALRVEEKGNYIVANRIWSKLFNNNLPA